MEITKDYLEKKLAEIQQEVFENIKDYGGDVIDGHEPCFKDNLKYLRFDDGLLKIFYDDDNREKPYTYIIPNDHPTPNQWGIYDGYLTMLDNLINILIITIKN